MHSTWSRKAFAVLKKQQKAGAQWPRRRASRDELWEAGWRQLTERFRLREVRILLQPSRKFHEGRHLLYLFSVGTPRPRTLLITQLALGRDPTDLECCPVSKSCLTLCSPTDCRMPGFPVLHYLPEFAQIHVHWVTSYQTSSHYLPTTQGKLPVVGTFSQVTEGLRSHIKPLA